MFLTEQDGKPIMKGLSIGILGLPDKILLRLGKDGRRSAALLKSLGGMIRIGDR
jgi:hypothetical protein